MSINDKLLDCRCGRKPEIHWGRTADECWAYVVCACGMKTSNQHGANDKQAAEAAIRVWNGVPADAGASG